MQLQEAWNTAQNTEDKREKIQALSLAKECYSVKLELLTNVTVVDDAIRFVSQQSKKNLESSDSDDSEHDKEESNEPDYDEGSARRRGNWTNDNKSGFLNSCLVHNKCNTCGD